MCIASYVDVHTCAYGLWLNPCMCRQCMLMCLDTMSFVGTLSSAGPINRSCADDVISMAPPTSTTNAGSTVITRLTEPPTEPSTEPSTEPLSTSVPTVESPSKVVSVRVTPGVQNTSSTLIVTWQAVAGGAVNYTVKYSTQPGEVNTPPEGALEVKGISGTSTILTALERGSTYYIWVVGMSEGKEGPHSDRMTGVTYDSELDSTILIHITAKEHNSH